MPPRTFRTAAGARLIVAAVAGCAALLLGNYPLVPWPARLAGWALLALPVLFVLWRDGRRRLELRDDRLVLVQGDARREVPFREIETWAIPLGSTLLLGLAGGERLALARWHEQGDLNAAIVTAIRLAGSTFDKQPGGATHRVRWS